MGDVDTYVSGGRKMVPVREVHTWSGVGENGSDTIIKKVIFLFFFLEELE